MMQPGSNILSSKIVLQNRYEKFAASLEAFSIANAIIWIGNIIYTINTNESLLNFSLIDMDLGIILMYASFTEIIDNTQMVLFAVLGWIVAGVRLKRKYHREANNLLFLSLIIPLSLLPVILIIFILNLTLSIFGFTIVVLLIPIILLVFVINLIGLIVVIPGLIAMEMVKEPNPLKSKVRSSANSLMLTGPIPPTPNEPVHFCIYRMRDKQGCAFLGYEVGNYPLICDFQSSWRSCRLYAHLYYKLVVLENEK